MNTRNKTLLTRTARALALLAMTSLVTLGVRTASAPTGPKGVAKAPVAQAPVQMRLTAARLQVTRDAEGHAQESWQPLADGTPVQGDDTLRYTLHIANVGPKPVQNFVVTQPIPPAMAYVPSSAGATGADGVQITFRVDGQAGYSAAPTVAEVQADGTTKRVPAPAASYRSIRWALTAPLAPGQSVQAVFDEKVR